MDLLYFLSLVIPAMVSFGVSVAMDKNNKDKRHWIVKLVSNIGASYFCYFYWPKPKEFTIYGFYPFPTIQLWIGFCALAGIYLFKNLFELLKKDKRQWAAFLGDKLTEYSKKKR